MIEHHLKWVHHRVLVELVIGLARTARRWQRWTWAISWGSVWSIPRGPIAVRGCGRIVADEGLKFSEGYSSSG